MKRNLLILGAFAVAAVAPAEAYIEALYPLQQFMNESQVIAEGVIDKSDAKTRTCVVKITKTLKGKCAYPELRINIGAGQEWHPDAVMKHLVVGAPALFFFDGGGRAEIYINRFFNQLYADGQIPEKAWWTFTHIEIRCNRTFNGTTEELTKLVGDVLAGKAKPPAPDAKIPPISKADVAALPVWGQPAENDRLPAPFRKRDPNAPVPAAPVPVNAEGFVQRWLVLGPITLGPQAADHSEAGQKAFFDKEWFPGQKSAQPRPLQKVSVAAQELRWEVGESTDFYMDFGPADNSMHFVVAYVVSDKDVPDATLATGSDDSAIWWLNGQEVIRVYQGRGVGKDQDRSKPLALKKGVNVLMGAVINGGGPTGAGARFLDKAGAPLAGLKAGAEPPK
jgi:hypothetical protein